MSYGVPSITIRSKDAHEGDFDPSDSAVPSLDIKFSHRLLENTATVCWLPLFTGMTIATGFPIPGRVGEIGREISLGLLAAVAGVCHATEFEGGIVIKGFCHMFVPVERTQNGVQWHAVTNEDSRTYMTYHDGISLCERRASKQEVGLEDVQSTRAFLGWCRVAHSRLGANSNDFDNLDFSGAPEASNSIQFTGAQFGLQQIGTVAGNFIIGGKQTRHCITFSGTYRNMILAAENILVVLYDTGTKRGYLFNSTDVMLHMMQHRHSRRPFKVSNNRIELRINVAAGSSATQVLFENENIPISDDDTYLFKHEIINIFSIVENLWNKTSTRHEDTPGMEMLTRYGTYLQGYEFNAIVRQHGTYKLIESKLEKSHGGWPQLIKDTGALVLLGNGFGDLILPADEDKSRLCHLWQRLPSGLRCPGYLKIFTTLPDAEPAANILPQPIYNGTRESPNSSMHARTQNLAVAIVSKRSFRHSPLVLLSLQMSSLKRVLSFSDTTDHFRRRSLRNPGPRSSRKISSAIQTQMSSRLSHVTTLKHQSHSAALLCMSLMPQSQYYQTVMGSRRARYGR
jgi:hypothetical protein